MKYTIEVDECDLCDMAVGRFMREGQVAADLVAVEGAGAFLDADPRTAQIPADPWRNWHVIAMSDQEGRELAVIAATRFREVVKKSTLDIGMFPWRDDESES